MSIEITIKYTDAEYKSAIKEKIASMPNKSFLIRTHVNLRFELFLPTVDNCPLPLEWLEILRRTDTSLENK